MCGPRSIALGTGTGQLTVERSRVPLKPVLRPRSRTWQETVSLALWSAFVRLMMPALWLRLWWRARREPGYFTHWRERWAWAPASAPAWAAARADGLAEVPEAPEAHERPVWIHAVSLGETLACVPLLEAWLQELPKTRFLLTHMTATGRAAGLEIGQRPALRGHLTQAWLPYDSPGAVRRFLRAHRPRLGLLMETEVWPNLLAACAAHKVPVGLVNARLSERSLRRARRLRWLIEPAMDSLAGVIAQTSEDARRFESFGVASVGVAGNLKFDRTVDAELAQRGQRWRAAAQGTAGAGKVPRTVVVAASTRLGEEADLLIAWQAVALSSNPMPLLVLVPRHPQRFDEVAQLAATTGLLVRRRSASPPGPEWSTVDVLIGDSMGELTAWYAMADVAILGGSLRPFGGQNLIEAAALAKPIVLGPHTENFAQAARDAVEAGAAQRVDSAAEAVQVACAIAQDAALQSAMASAGLRWVGQHRGAAVRTVRAALLWAPAEGVVD